MKVKKVVKKIAALGIGATMVGATLFGASAATLADYPKVLSKDGEWNALFVIGEQADSIDTIGMTNIVSGVQDTPVGYEASTTTTTTAVATGVEGVDPIETTGNKFNVNNDIEDIQDSLDETDEGMENILAAETYSDSEGENTDDVDYTQELSFTDGTATFMFTQDDDDAPVAGPYLQFVDTGSVYAYTYTLEFEDAVEFDATSESTASDDMKGTTLEIQGQKYTITDVSTSGTSGNQVIDDITLMAGETVQWMTQGDKITKTIGGVEHEITMVDVSADSADDKACGFDVDGTSLWIDLDETRTINGVTLGVTEAKTVNNKDSDADICEVNIGATELKLIDGDKVEKAGKEIDGSEVSLSKTVGGTIEVGELSGITVTFIPEDDVFLAPGEELVDPVFGNFKFVFGGVNAEREEIKLSASNDDAELTLINPDGKEITIPFFFDEDETGNGDDGEFYIGEGIEADEMVYISGANVVGALGACDFSGTGELEDCEGARFVVMDGDKVAHVVEVSNIDEEDLEVSFKDLTYGVESNNNDFLNAATTDMSISGISGDLKFDIDNGNEELALYSEIAVLGNAETEFEGTLKDIAFGANEDSMTITFLEGFEGDTDDTVTEQTQMVLTIEDNADHDEIELAVTAFQTPAAGVLTTAVSPLAKDADDDDNEVYVTSYGSTVAFDTDAEDEIVIMHPKEAITANVYVAPTGAASTETSTTGGNAIKKQVSSSATVFDTEVADWKAQNVVSVGGPCANSVSAHIFGDPSPCYSGFETGKAILKLVENGDNVAITVAGGSGEDTRLLAQILQDYDSYDLSGMDMVATTVSASSLSIGPMTEEVVVEEEEVVEETTEEETTTEE